MYHLFNHRVIKKSRKKNKKVNFFVLCVCYLLISYTSLCVSFAIINSSFVGTTYTVTLDVDLETEQPEKGFVLSGEYLMELPYDVNFLPFAEVAYFNNYDGMEDRNLTYFTTFLPIIIDGWHFIATNTFKFDNESGYKNYFSHLTQLSAGYKFDCGLMLDFAKIWEKNTMKADGFAGVGNKQKWTHDSDSWAFMVSYSFKF